MGLIYDQNDQEGNALDCFNKAVSLLKKDKKWISYAYVLRARVNTQLGNDDLALKDWKASLKENPNDEITLTDRAQYYLYKGEYVLAEADYDALISSQPGNTAGYLGKGKIAFQNGQYDSAVKLFSYCISLDPNSSDAYALRAKTYLALNRNNEAADDIITALGIDSNSTVFSLLENIKSPAKEILLTKLRIQQSKDRNNGLWSYVQGVVYEDANDYDNAIKAYDTSNKISINCTAMYRLSLCHFELGEYNSALDCINRAILMDSTRTDYLKTKVNCLYESGRTKDAIDVLGTYIEKEPDDFFGYYRRGFIKSCTDDIDGAINDYTTSLVLEPRYTYALIERANCYKLKGNTNAANADYKKAIEECIKLYSADTTKFHFNIDDKDILKHIPYYYFSNMQYAYLGLGKKDLAIAVQDSILAHNDDKSSYYDAACLYSKMGI